jgi:hypothetical protein
MPKKVVKRKKSASARPTRTKYVHYRIVIVVSMVMVLGAGAVFAWNRIHDSQPKVLGDKTQEQVTPVSPESEQKVRQLHNEVMQQLLNERSQK